jgi:hypothetical protein
MQEFISLGRLRRKRPDINKAAKFAELVFSKKLDPDTKVFNNFREPQYANKHKNNMNLHLDFNEPTSFVHEFIHMLETTEFRNIIYLNRVNSRLYKEGRAKFIQELYRKLERDKYDIADEASNTFEEREIHIRIFDDNILEFANQFDPNRLPKTPRDRGAHPYLIPDEEAPKITFLKNPLIWINYILFYKSLRKIAVEVGNCIKAFDITTQKPPNFIGKIFPLIYYGKEIEEQKKNQV